MKIINSDIAVLEDFDRTQDTIKWYAIADSAQHSDLPFALLDEATLACCLFGHSQESLIGQCSPYLVELDPPRQESKRWRWITSNAKSKPCISVIAAQLPFDELFFNLTQCMDVLIPGEESIFLAFWDPAILGTLVGQESDDTLYVKGPVLNLSQRAMLARGMRQWSYWDRYGKLHAICESNAVAETEELRIRLDQSQVDALVEASVPDHILHYLGKNQSALVHAIPFDRRYEIIIKSLGRARDIGLIEMRDLVNYICAELFYKERMAEEESIVYLLRKVKSRDITLDEAIRNFP